MAVTKAAVDGNLWQNETPNCRHQTLIGVHTMGWCVKATKMIQMYNRHLFIIFAYDNESSHTKYLKKKDLSAY